MDLINKIEKKTDEPGTLIVSKLEKKKQLGHSVNN